MKKYLKLYSLFILTLNLSSNSFSQQLTFTADWNSLHNYKVPDWYRDAKFGIFMHWGVQSVPAHENGWYARQMYEQDSAEWGHTYDYHIQNYGHPSKFGYKDLIPLWKAEKWDPDALVRLYKKIGAKYIVPVAVHHDNFDNYASSFQPWNSVNMGPKKDIVGMWAKAVRKYNLRFGVSSHSDRSWDWFQTSHGSDTKGPMKNISYDGNLTKADGKNQWWEGYNPQDLYSRKHSKSEAPDSAYCYKWYNRTKELIDKYKPDLLWFDGPLPLECSSCEISRSQFEKYGLNIASYFYNNNMKWHDGKLEAVLNIKSYGKGSVPDSSAIVLDIEKGQTKDILPDPWQTDTSIPGDWYYDSKPAELSDTVLIHNLCDIVSKNGNLLLNVGLRADGTLPDDQLHTLENVGKWLEVNGEAIYGTRPWKIFGEGPTSVAGEYFQQNKKPFTSDDIRFTSKGNILYAIVLGWPRNRTITVHSLNNESHLNSTSFNAIELLGSKKPIKWSVNNDGLKVLVPEERPCAFAYVLKIALKNN